MFTGKPHATGCTVCGKPKIYSRGLCEPHYRRFNKEYKRLVDTKGQVKADQLETLARVRGWLLEKSKGGRKREADPFTELAEMVIAEETSDYRNERDKLIAEGNEFINKEVATAQAKRPTKTKRKSGDA